MHFYKDKMILQLIARFRKYLLMVVIMIFVVVIACAYPPWFIKVWQGRVHLVLGGIYCIAGHPSNALDHYKEARDICNKYSAGKYEMRALLNMGDIYYELGNCSKTITCYQEALAVAKNYHYEWGVCQMLNALAIIYDDLGDYQKALYYYEEVQEASKSMGFIKYPTDSIENRITEISGVIGMGLEK
jgi:tetratricopeptide (TPR) repeat protein